MDNMFGGLLGVVVGLVALTVAVMWIIFPVIVYSKFNELLKIEKQSLDQQRENAKALQWIIDNSKRNT